MSAMCLRGGAHNHEAVQACYRRCNYVFSWRCKISSPNKLVRGFRKSSRATDHTGSRVMPAGGSPQLPQPRLVGDVLGRKQPSTSTGQRRYVLYIPTHFSHHKSNALNESIEVVCVL